MQILNNYYYKYYYIYVPIITWWLNWLVLIIDWILVIIIGAVLKKFILED